MSKTHESLYGKVFYEPRASIRSRVEAEGDAKAKHFNEIVILGSGVKRGDPDPDSILRFRNSVTAKNILGTGVVLDLMKLCWNPSKEPDVLGANYIPFIRVGNPTQASLTVTDGATGVLTFTSRDYGNDSNNIRIKIENGTVEGKKVTIAKIDDDGRDIVNAWNNMRNAMSVQYTGTGTACTMTITVASDLATTLTTAVTGASSDDLSLTLSDTAYNTTSKLVNYINSQANYTATINAYVDPLQPTYYLDAVAAQDIATSAYTCTSILGSIIWKVSTYDPHVTCARISGQTTAPININYTNMTGGTDNGGLAISTANYVAALTKLEQESLDAGLILVESTSAAVHAAVASWVKLRRENDEGRWHVFLGHPKTETSADVAARCYRLNNKDVTMATPGPKIYDENNVLQSYDSVYYAAILAGQDAGSGLQQPLTNNIIPIDQVYTKYTIDERETLIQAGATVAKYDKKRSQFITTYALTTYTGSDSRFDTILFVKRECDHIEWNIKTYVEQRFTGKKGRQTTPNAIASLVIQLLTDFEEKDEILLRNPADPDSQAWTIPSVTIASGTGTASISFSAWYADELDFFDIEQGMQLQKLESTVNVQI